MIRSLPSAEQEAIERNGIRRENAESAARINAETRIAKQLQSMDSTASWSEALRSAKDIIDRLPTGADLAMANAAYLAPQDASPEL